MKSPKPKKAMRAFLMSALIVALLSCMSVFLAVNAAENTEQTENVTGSDAVDVSVENESQQEFINSEEITPKDILEDEAKDDEVVNLYSGHVTEKQIADSSHYLFLENAHYNGSFRSELNENEQYVYDALYNEFVVNRSQSDVDIDISSFGYTYDTSTGNVDDSTMNELRDVVLSAFAAFTTDHPEVYWISGYGFSIDGSGGFLTGVALQASERYTGAYNQLATVTNGISNAVNAIDSLRESSSRYDTAKAIHDYICDNMEYDYTAASNSNYGEAHCIAPLFGGGRRGKQFVCEGYANSFKLLCDRFNVPAVHVKGNAGGPHSWNYVQMDDNCWYGVDCTWDDDDTVGYTYFAIGSNTPVYNGKTFGVDHVPEDQVMSSNTVFPLVYPPLEYEAYAPGENFDFYGSSCVNNREVSGSVDLVWRYRGSMSVNASVTLSVDGSQIATINEMDQNGCFYYTLDVSGLANGSHTLTAVFQRLGGMELSASRTIIVKNPSFEFCNWPGENPTFGFLFNLMMRQQNGGSAINCHVDIYVDDIFADTLYCDNDGYFSYNIDPSQLGEGSHTVRAVFRNTSGLQIEKSKSFVIAYPAFEILDKNALSAISGTAQVRMRQSNCGGVDDCHVDLYIDNAMTATLYCDANGIFTYDIDTTQLSNGVHSLRAVLVCNSGTELSDTAVMDILNVIPAQSITLNRDSAEITVGQSLTLTAEVLPATTSDEVVWTSDDANVAEVKSNGIVTAIAEGNTVIRATAGSVSCSCTVTVTPAPESYPVRINRQYIRLFITDNSKAPAATLSVQKPKYIKSVVWYSDDPEVATVDRKGKVTGHKNGTANIYCKFANGEIVSAPCKVYVSTFTIDTSSLTSLQSCNYIGNVYWVGYNESAQLGVNYSDLSPDTITDPIVWKSSSSIARVDGSGLLSCGGKKGTVTITAYKGKSLRTSISVRVYQPAQSLILNNYAPSVYVNKAITLKSILSKGSDEPVFWSSSNESVATVSSKGVVKGISQGEATIYARTASGFTEGSNVTVRTGAKSLTWDTVNPGMNSRGSVKFNIGVGDSKYLYAKITSPENCNDTITWSTSDRRIVSIETVLSNGRGVNVTGIKKGSVSIVAKTGSGKKVTYIINVVPEGAAQITLSKHNVSLYTGASVQLTAKVQPKGCNDAVIWNSADTSIATVDENGRITAVAQGDTTVTAYSTVTNVTDVVSVHVMTKASNLTWNTVPEGLNPLKTVNYAIWQWELFDVSASITAPENCNDTITWSTSNSRVVYLYNTNDAEHSVTLLGYNPGTATITAKTGSGKKIAYQITVVASGAGGIVLGKTQASVYERSSVQIPFRIDPKGCKDVVMWYSDNPEVATVNESGKVTGVAMGDATIMAYSTRTGVSAQVQIHVMSKATGFTWDTVPEGMSPRKAVKFAVAPNDEMILSTVITAPENCNDIITWSNSNKKAVNMQPIQDNPRAVKITGIAKGSATIIAKTGSGKKLSYIINVVPSAASGIILGKHETTIYKGTSLQISAKIQPKGCNDVLLWKSQNPEIATVDENGVITAISNGMTNIVAYSATNGEISDSISVRVITKATAIDVDKTDVFLGIGESIDVSTTIAPVDCEDIITWSSSSKAIATVTPTGNGSTATINAIKLGNCTVVVKTGSGKYKKINVSVYK